MDFISWHYSLGVDYYIKSVVSTIKWFLHYFSIPLLLKTLFSPWKRMVTIDTSPGFNFQKRFEAFTFNAVSVVIGFITRVILIVSGIVFVFVAALGGAIGFLFWLILPFLSLEVFAKYKRQPSHFTQNLIEGLPNESKLALKAIFETEAGKFVLEHVNLTATDTINGAVDKEVSFKNLSPNGFFDVMKKLIEADALWSDDFYHKNKVTASDFLSAATLWDQKRYEQTKMNEASFGRPGIALELTYGYTPTLDKYVSDMARLQDFSHHLIARGDYVSRMERILSGGSNVMLTGIPGVGKKTTIYEFATKAANGEFGSAMSFKRVLEFDYNSVISATSDVNQKKQELSQIFAEAAAAGNVILVIKDLQRLTNREVEGYDFTDIIEGHLEKRKLKIIALVSNADYERFIFPNSRLAKFFERMEVLAAKKEEALEILLSAAMRWEVITKLTITIPAIRTIIDESDRYISETPFPEKAMELLDSIVSYKEQKGGNIVTTDDVNAVLSEKTGISFVKMTESEGKKLAKIEDLIHERLINQEAAVGLIGKTLRAKTIGVVKESRPLGSFLFLGPTGVGKTETAKVLAKVYYGSEDSISRFDMSEYSGSEGLERLIGSVTRGLPGALTTQIKNKPANLLLLDELEKASREVLNLFLTVLDEGYILDAFGKKVSARNLFVIGTSNAGAAFIRQKVEEGLSGDGLRKAVVDFILAEKLFSPEFLNRFDGVVVYEPLTHEHLRKVAQILLTELGQNLRSKNIKITYGPKVVEKLANDGFEPAFGARPMKRLINLFLGDTIGKAILEGRVKEGDTIKILAGSKKEEFSVQKV